MGIMGISSRLDQAVITCSLCGKQPLQQADKAIA